MSRPFNLTERDHRILLLLGEYGCVTADRIKSHFWNENPNSRAHYRRIGFLKRRGVIENVQGDGATLIGYRLTRRGKRFLSEGAASSDPQAVRRSYKTQFEHDQLLIDVRQILLRSPLVTAFRTEAEMRRALHGEQSEFRHWDQHPTIPDASFLFVAGKTRMQIALELELSLKSKKRYARIFRNHLLSKSWRMVIYIVRDSKLRETLMNFLEKIRSTDAEVKVGNSLNGIYFCTLPDFQTLLLETPMSNGKREISFAGLAKYLGVNRHEHGVAVGGESGNFLAAQSSAGVTSK